MSPAQLRSRCGCARGCAFLLLLAGSAPGARSQEPVVDDLDRAKQVLRAENSSREQYRAAAGALWFDLGEAGIEEVRLALRRAKGVAELTGTVEGAVLEALREAWTARSAEGHPPAAAALDTLADWVQVLARPDAPAAARRVLQAWLANDLRPALLERFRTWLALEGETPDPMASALLQVASLLRVPELVPLAYRIREARGLPIELRLGAERAMVGLAQQGFRNEEELEAWTEELRSGAKGGEDLAWEAADRLREELRRARIGVIARSRGDLDLLLASLADPTFPAVREAAAATLAELVATFRPDHDEAAIERVLSELLRRIEVELFPAVRVALAQCLENLAPLARHARGPELEEGEEVGAEEQARRQRFLTQTKRLRDLLILLVPLERWDQTARLEERTRAVQALRWFEDDGLVVDHVLQLLREVVSHNTIHKQQYERDYDRYRRSVIQTAARLRYRPELFERVLAEVVNLTLDTSPEVRRLGLVLLRSLGEERAEPERLEQVLAEAGRLARDSREARVRVEALATYAELAERSEGARWRAEVLAAFSAAAADPRPEVRRFVVDWFAARWASPGWGEELATVAAQTAELRLARPEGEALPDLRSAWLRSLAGSRRLEDVRILVARASDEEIASSALNLRRALDQAPRAHLAERIEIAEILGARRPMEAAELLEEERRADARSATPEVARRAEALVLELAWRSYARLEDFETAPSPLGRVALRWIETLLDSLSEPPAGDAAMRQRIDLEIRIGRTQEAAARLARASAAYPDPWMLEDRRTWLDHRFERWTQILERAARSEAAGRPDPCWWIRALVFEARLARDRFDGREHRSEIVREARALIETVRGAEGGAERTARQRAVLQATRRADVLSLLEQRGELEAARELLAALPALEVSPLEALPRALERRLAEICERLR